MTDLTAEQLDAGLDPFKMTEPSECPTSTRVSSVMASSNRCCTFSVKAGSLAMNATMSMVR